MKNARSYVFILGFTLLVLTNSRQTAAQFQDSMGSGWNNAMSASASTMIWNSIFYRTPQTGASRTRPTATSNAASSQSRQAPSPPPNRPVDEATMRFKFSGTYIKTRELADHLGNTQAERDQYYNLMNAVLQGFDKQAAAANKPNDIPLALSYFLAENLRIYRGQPELSDSQFLEIRNAIAAALGESGAIRSFSERQKQEMYEILVAYTGITQYGYEEAQKAGNQQFAKGYQQVAAQNLQTVTKLSPDDINFGPNGLSAAGDSSSASPPSAAQSTGAPVDIYQLRSDYSENDVRADQIYKGKRFLFVGTVIEVSNVHRVTVGQDEIGRYIYKDLGTNLHVSNAAGTVIGSDVYCFFRDNNQLAQIRRQQKVTFEATVKGREQGSTNLDLVDAVLR